MKKQPNLFVRAAVIAIAVGCGKSLYDMVQAHMPIAASPESLAWFAAAAIFNCIAAFVPVGLLVLAWAAIARLISRRAG